MKRKLWTGVALGLLLALLCCGAASADDQGTCGEYLTWTYRSAEKTLYIGGTGDMTVYGSYTEVPWYVYESAVETIKIYNNVTSISRYAFYGCTSLTSVTIPGNVTSIGYCAFANCISLTSAVIFNPSAVIGDYDHDVFRDCPTSLTLYGWSGSSAETYASAANLRFTGWTQSGKCGENATWTLTEDSYSHDNLTLTISGTGEIHLIGGASPGFRDAKIAIKSIQIKEGITRVGNSIFTELDHVTSVWIPDSVTSIGTIAFRGCKRLASISIPASVTSIEYSAFEDCPNLKYVYIYNPSVTFGDEVFYRCHPDLTVCCFAGSTAAAYAAGWGYDCEEWPASGFCGHNASWSFDPVEGKLSITGRGNMRDYDGSDPEWSSYKSKILSVEIGEGVTSVGARTFVQCYNLASVTLPASVTRIGERAFYISGLTGLKIPEGVTEIGEYAFFACSGMKNVTIPNSLVSIGEEAFVACNALENVTLPNSVTNIANHAFGDCQKLKNVKIYNMNAAFGTDVFYNAPADLTIYGWPYSTAKTYASQNGIAFRQLDIPNPDFFLPAGLTAVSSETFTGIKAKAPVIPKGVTSIAGNPFAVSGVQVIYGYYNSAADTFASTYGYYFIPIDDAWMASHTP